MTLLSLDILGKTISVNIPDCINDWLITKNEKYRPDREDFVLQAFKEAYPSIDVNDAKMVYKLASRSEKLNEWLAKVNSDYALLQNEPTFYREIIDANEYKKVVSDIQKASVIARERAEAELKAAQDYKAAMDKIDKKYGEFKYSSKYSKIINLPSVKLPLSFQLAIENFVPADIKKEEDGTKYNLVKKSFAREVLVSYKVQLLEAVKKDPDFDVDKAIADAQEK